MLSCFYPLLLFGSAMGRSSFWRMGSLIELKWMKSKHVLHEAYGHLYNIYHIRKKKSRFFPKRAQYRYAGLWLFQSSSYFPPIIIPQVTWHKALRGIQANPIIDHCSCSDEPVVSKQGGNWEGALLLEGEQVVLRRNKSNGIIGLVGQVKYAVYSYEDVRCVKNQFQTNTS